MSCILSSISNEKIYKIKILTLITRSVLFTKLDLDFIFTITTTQAKYSNIPKFIIFTNLNTERKNVITNFSKNIHFTKTRERTNKMILISNVSKFWKPQIIKRNHNRETQRSLIILPQSFKNLSI